MVVRTVANVHYSDFIRNLGYNFAILGIYVIVFEI
jgi:hypothetical protein